MRGGEAPAIGRMQGPRGERLGYRALGDERSIAQVTGALAFALMGGGELEAADGRGREALDAIPPLLERFRQSVLAAAFRGDLTADWRAKHPDVEPASVLLERIREDTERDNFMGAEEAKIYGLIDEILERREPVAAG